MLETHSNIEVSWDRFLIDFGRVLRGSGEVKTGFSLESGTNFTIFGYLNISLVLETKITPFWLRFGGPGRGGSGHVGVREPARSELKLLFRVFRGT